MNTPEKVEQTLHESIASARANGVRVAEKVVLCREVRDGVTCACALGCVADRFEAAARVLKISFDDAAEIARGFDGGFQHGKWSRIGARLRAEFLTPTAC